MHSVKKTFIKDDCIHYKVARVRACCGRHEWRGVCASRDDDGIVRHKTCSTKMKHCNYIPKEEENVHST
jgi:hypothetical protein